MIKKISLCMIVKNEALGLARFLEHVYPFVDEIILGDTGSTDNTLAIAEEFPKVEIMHIEWEDDFSKARNQVLANANGKWILVLDVDEFIDLADFLTLKKIANKYISKACLLPIRHYINDVSRPGFVFAGNDNTLSRGALGYVETTKIAFFENDKRIRYSGLIHETVQDSLKAINEVPVRENVVMHHYGYLKSDADLKLSEEKYNYYLQLGKKQIEKTPDAAKPYLDTALVYLNNGDYQNSMLFLDKALAIDENYLDALYNKGAVSFLAGNYNDAYEVFFKLKSLPYDKKSVLDSLGRVCMKLHKYDEAVNFFKEAICLDDKNIYAFYNLAVILQAQKKYIDANQYFLSAIALNPRFMNAYLGSGICLLSMGDLNAAFEMFCKVAEDVPVYKEALYHIGFIYQQQNKYKEALDAYSGVLNQGVNINALYNSALCCEGLEDKEQAVKFYEQVLKEDPSLEKDILTKLKQLSN